MFKGMNNLVVSDFCTNCRLIRNDYGETVEEYIGKAQRVMSETVYITLKNGGGCSKCVTVARDAMNR